MILQQPRNHCGPVRSIKCSSLSKLLFNVFNLKNKALGISRTRVPAIEYMCVSIFRLYACLLFRHNIKLRWITLIRTNYCSQNYNALLSLHPIFWLIVINTSVSYFCFSGNNLQYIKHAKQQLTTNTIINVLAITASQNNSCSKFLEGFHHIFLFWNCSSQNYNKLIYQ